MRRFSVAQCWAYFLATACPDNQKRPKSIYKAQQGSVPLRQAKGWNATVKPLLFGKQGGFAPVAGRESGLPCRTGTWPCRSSRRTRCSTPSDAHFFGLTPGDHIVQRIHLVLIFDGIKKHPGIAGNPSVAWLARAQSNQLQGARTSQYRPSTKV